MHDFGIMGMTVPHLESDRCVSCGACVKACKKKSVEALKPVNFRPQRDERRCIGCGECVLACPNAAWTRSEKNTIDLLCWVELAKRTRVWVKISSSGWTKTVLSKSFSIPTTM